MSEVAVPESPLARLLLPGCPRASVRGRRHTQGWGFPCGGDRSNAFEVAVTGTGTASPVRAGAGAGSREVSMASPRSHRPSSRWKFSREVAASSVGARRTVVASATPVSEAEELGAVVG